ncbi:hypothetical protein K1T71_010321 [Dendrolimus kikuchii]|uniref:Uncharacterized protein n=1 Tax=Dendrolimus kikuchii TaxID=765133 RepID=A0ACC1CRK7_9NEOP|nr:hypothetical protein K1T71_010321 [Dendrolimus kikuchii]
MTESQKNKTSKKVRRGNFNLRCLRLSLKYRPDVMRLILKMRQCIRKRNSLVSKLKLKLKKTILFIAINLLQECKTTSNNLPIDNNGEVEFIENKDYITNDNNHENVNESITEHEIIAIIDKHKTKDTSTQTEDLEKVHKEIPNVEKVKETEWNVNDKEKGKSIAEQVKEVAQSALQQSGMVYVESAGMYYDYKTGYYYNSELGLYYHTDTGCYYYYSEEKQSFVFHSYPDRSAQSQIASLAAHNMKKAKKHKMEKGANKPKKRKIAKKPKVNEPSEKEKKIENPETIDNDIVEDNIENPEEVNKEPKEMEDGECSDTENEQSNDEASDDSTSTASDDESVARHHPPCMRVIVRETNLPKLKVGSLFLITKDGGTVGREGEQHTIIIRDHNVSRNHLDIEYDMDKSAYVVTDLGSKNGTILNGKRMSDSQEVSKPMEVLHGSTIQLGETKLLCHIHPGNDTCGHCEPGLLMETQEKEKKVAYTRTCSIQKQHELELARLKNKYAPQPLMIEEKVYNDRAQARRDAVGSSHHSEKTQSTDLETSIAPENKGFKLLEKMGWSKGEGLGKDNQGDTEPVPLISNEGTSGLGASGTNKKPNLMPIKMKINNLGPATLRLASKTRMLQPPAQAFLNDNEEEDNLDKEQTEES